MQKKPAAKAATTTATTSTATITPTPEPENLVYQKRLELLKAEVDQYQDSISFWLKKGMKSLILTDLNLGKDLDPESLLLLGGIAVLCRLHGATLTFVAEDNMIAVTTEAAEKSKKGM